MTINPQRAQTVFLAVLELSEPAARREFLDRECAGDQALRQRVEALLGAHDASGGFGVEPSGAGYDPTIFKPFTEHRGTIIAGRYKLLEAIGEGGMGSVWVAEQREPVRRKVAIKLIKAGMDSKSVLARFEAERQALAMMDHPNIAKVFDGGMTEQGRPFFAMEYVKGVPLTDYCDQARLSLKERLQLFMPVCQAVQHAHQKGIIHRDLKPSNILICLYDGKPVPKVIDFGLAKAMHQSLTDQSLHTAHGVMVGTPLYMSPEQAEHNNLDVDTRTDIYSLGVILYELLTGSTPLERQQMKAAAFNEILRLIKEVEPPKPSTRLSSNQNLPSVAAQRSIKPNDLRRSLSGELDWIVMKTLEKERSRRYDTALSLATDIQRFLNGEAVDACPPSTSYRLQVFLRQHRVAIITVSAFVLLMVVGTIISAWQALRAMQAEAEVRISLDKEADARGIAETARFVADAERAKAEAAVVNEVQYRAAAEKARDQVQRVLDAMTSAVTGDALSKQSELSEEQRVFLNQALSYYKELANMSATDQTARVRAAEAALRVGEIQHRLGLTSEAIATFTAAVDDYSQLSKDSANNAHFREMVAKSNNNLGLVLVQASNLKEGIGRYQNAQKILEILVEEFPNANSHKLALVGTFNNWALALIRLQQFDEATQHLEKATLILKILLTIEPNSPEYRHEMARVDGNLGLAYNGSGQFPKALAQFRTSLSIQESLVEEFPNIRKYRQDLAINHNNVGLMVSSLESKEAAVPHYLRAIELREKLAVDFPLVPEYRRELAKSHGALTELLAGMGQFEDSLQHGNKALLILENLIHFYPTSPIYRSDLSRNHAGLGIVMNSMGKPAEANDQFVKSQILFEQLAAQFPDQLEYLQEVGTSHNNSAVILTEIGKRQEALPHHRKALQIRQRMFAAHPTSTSLLYDLTFSQNNLGALLVDMRQHGEAKEVLASAMANGERLTREQPEMIGFQVLLGMVYFNLGDLSLSDNQPDESVSWFEKGIQVQSAVPKPGRDTTAELLLRSCQRGLNKARLLNRETLEIDADLNVQSQNSSWSSRDWYDLACVYAIAVNMNESEANELETRAFELLRMAIRSGWKDVEMLKSDPELEPIRAATEFSALVAELEK